MFAYASVCARAYVLVAGTGGIYSSAGDGRTATCASCVVLCHRADAHACVFALYWVIGRFARVAAGVTWMTRTTSAPWAARYWPTTVIDAAGAIYVIGGYSGTFLNRDVWASTDGGADRT